MLVDNTWHPGVLREWRTEHDGWHGWTKWSRAGETFVDVFPVDRIRSADETPRQAGDQPPF